jgi:hypothetical protein
MRALHDGLTASVRYGVRHRQAQLCTHCPNPRAAGKTKCEGCLRKQRERYYERSRIQLRKAA